MGDDANALPPGTRIDDYEIRQWLGGGGFGITYLARDLQLDLPVALKEFFPADCAFRGPGGQVLPRSSEGPDRLAFTTGLERFVDEARALANFRHPNIVRVLRHLRSHGTACIVMEYERGDPLKRWLGLNQPLTEPALLALLLPLLAGLEAVHAAGFLHRDIKPDNIYVRSDGSPVLLDFGAARRVVAGGAATSIVSPGFAPFEQYHANGEQGPWSDLYALGAVMYWLVTGCKPLEAAARVEADALVPARQRVEPGRFSDGLLQAITWAMQPQAAQRPQTVSAFREALRAAASESARRADAGTTSQPFSGNRSGPLSSPLSAALSGPLPVPRTATPALAVLPRPSPEQLAQLTRRNLLATIAFLDLVAYSARSVDEQVRIKRRLNELLVQSLRGVPAERCLAMDTGDGAALCFLGDPEEALDCTLLLRDLIGRPHSGSLPLRIGLHLGPVRVVADLNDRLNVVGDGINVAQRVMSFAQARELLVSGGFHACVAPISEARARQFRYLGTRQDKHGRVHDLHAAVHSERSTDATSSPSTTTPTGSRTAAAATRLSAREADNGSASVSELSATPTVRMRGGAELRNISHPREGEINPHLLAELEAALCQLLGPMARVLVRRQARLAENTDQLIEALASLINTPAQREAFRKAAGRALGS